MEISINKESITKKVTRLDEAWDQVNNIKFENNSDNININVSIQYQRSSKLFKAVFLNEEFESLVLDDVISKAIEYIEGA